MNTSNPQKALIAKLQSKDSVIISNAIDDFRNKGTINVFPYVLDLLTKNINKDIENKVITLLNNLKEKEVVPYIVDAILDVRFAGKKELLLASCWQSGLNYADYLEVFIDVALNDSYQNAIEAFSVIESTPKYTQEQKQKAIKTLKENIPSINDSKKELLVEIVHFFEQ